MKWGLYVQKTIIALLITIISILLIPQVAAMSYTSHAYGTGQYQQYGFTPRIPVLVGGESRPEGYGIVPAGPAYPLQPSTFRENNLFVGHRSSWDGVSTHYSAFTGQPRLAPRLREANPRYNPQQHPIRYTTARLRIPQNTGYGPWYSG